MGCYLETQSSYSEILQFAARIPLLGFLFRCRAAHRNFLCCRPLHYSGFSTVTVMLPIFVFPHRISILFEHVPLTNSVARISAVSPFFRIGLPISNQAKIPLLALTDMSLIFPRSDCGTSIFTENCLVSPPVIVICYCYMLRVDYRCVAARDFLRAFRIH